MSEGFDTKSAETKTSFLPQRKPTEVASIGATQQSLVDDFGDIKDPRVERTKKHQLPDIVIIAILAAIAGAQGWEDIENYRFSKQQWLQKCLALPNGIPLDDTFRRVFEFINPEELNRCFLQWVKTLVTKMKGEIIPIDGKAIRGSYDCNRSSSALHVISALASQQNLAVAQRKVEDKSNEITALPTLLELLDTTGSIITIDVMGTQTEMAKKIIDKKADYVLALKANHRTLYHQVEQGFKQASAHNFHSVDVSYEQRIEKGHYRTEIRQFGSVPVAAIGVLYQPRLWAGLQSVVMVVWVRHLWNQTTREVQFYLTCLHSDAQLLGRGIRKHWAIENQAHWTRLLYFRRRFLWHSLFPQSS